VEAEMTIHLNITSELEQKLRKVADQMGLTPDTYIVRLLQKDLQSQDQPVLLSPEESKLFKQINASLSRIKWDHYRILLAKRDAEALDAQEQAELVAISDKIEKANVRRMKAVTELARLRKISFPALMKTLGLSFSFINPPQT
jgi:antitoxin component of RelBE/YafQ-DinJ toxin-antitoxin module